MKFANAILAAAAVGLRARPDGSSEWISDGRPRRRVSFGMVTEGADEVIIIFVRLKGWLDA